MKSLARRLAVPTLLFIAVLATGALALNAWTAEDVMVVPAQAEGEEGDDGDFISDAAEADAGLRDTGDMDTGGLIDAPEDPDAPPLTDAPSAFEDAGSLFFDAPNAPGGPPGT